MKPQSRHETPESEEKSCECWSTLTENKFCELGGFSAALISCTKHPSGCCTCCGFVKATQFQNYGTQIVL